MKAIDRVGAFSGAAYVLLANLSAALVGVGPEGAESPGQRVLDESQRIAENPWARLSLALVVLATMAFMMFVGYLCSLVRNAGWLATTALVGGILAIMANLASMTIVFTIAALRDDLSPEVARVLETGDGAGHLAQLLSYGVFAFFASAAALVTRMLGRVLSWAGMAVGATSIVVLAASGLPASDEFFLWPFLLVILWIVVISLRLGFARNRKTGQPVRDTSSVEGVN
ncbi:hypothetical protein [Mycetocola sp. 2940]|uniref:hypothetical protein n=1 Tax=Mycetocola sp. 2940 TaxID=3156452 RepID=UPI003399C8DC